MAKTVLYNYETTFHLADESRYTNWIGSMALAENFQIGKLSFIFCNDDYLFSLNQQFLNHDTLTDVITFEYTDGKLISGDIFISIDRVIENSLQYNVNKDQELLRVMAHGILHLVGYNDKSEHEALLMRAKEDEMIKMFHVEQ